MIKKLVLLSLIFTICVCTLNAQQTWSLEKCINYALQNSLTMKQAELGVENARLTEKANKMQRMPTLNANASGGYSFGRTIDPTTNTFQSISRGTNGFSLGANYTLYNGGAINNSIKQSKYALSAQKAETDNISNNISLSVAAAYINILFSEEQLANAQKRLELTQEQLNQTDRLIQAGSLPENDRLQIVAQIAQDEQLVITQENNVIIGYLDLKNLLQLEPGFDLEIESPDDITIPAGSNPDLYDFSTVYNQALQTQPIIKAGELRMKSAALGVDIAKSGMLPSIGLFGNIRTDFATQVPDFANPDLDNISVELGDGDLVNIEGFGDVIVRQYETNGVIFPDRQYFDQLSDNFGQSVGIQVSIPIYNQHRNQINIERARLDIISAEVNNEQNKQQLKADIQRSIADAKAAKKQLEAAQRTVDALQASYENTQKRYNLGASNTFEFTSAKNQLDRSQVDLTIAKFDYLYKLKIVDFYQGKRITL